MVRVGTLYDFNLGNLLRLVLRPNVWSLLENVPHTLKNNVYSAVVGCSVCLSGLGSFLSCIFGTFVRIYNTKHKVKTRETTAPLEGQNTTATVTLPRRTPVLSPQGALWPLC